MLARSKAECQLVLTKFKDSDDSEWHVTKWVPFNLVSFRQKPAWLVVLYGHRRNDLDIQSALADPLDTEVDQRQVERIELTLPVVLQTLTNGTQEEKLKMLGDLHKKMYHKSADQMRHILKRSGVPLRTLALVGDAVQACAICARWSKPGTKPAVRTQLATSFNERVYGDLLFFDDGQVFLFLIDESIRYSVIVSVTGKSFDTLEQAYRRGWIAQFGPPRSFISDREGALSGDAFGIYLEKTGTTRVLYTAKDDMHTRLGVLDRRILLFREMAPRLADQLADDGFLIEEEDLAAECQLSLNLVPIGGTHCPYECLFGSPPNDLLDLELETMSSLDEPQLPFYRHQICRVRATQILQ